MESKQLPAPWRPQLQGVRHAIPPLPPRAARRCQLTGVTARLLPLQELDTSNFDAEFTRMVPMDTPAAASGLSESVQQKFAGFTFVDQGELGLA